MESFCCVSCHPKTYPASHRVTQVVRLIDTETIEHHDDVIDPTLQVIGGRIMRFIACSVSSGVKENQPVPVPELRGIPKIVPTFQSRQRPVMQNQWYPVAFDKVMDANSFTVRVGQENPLG